MLRHFGSSWNADLETDIHYAFALLIGQYWDSLEVPLLFMDDS